MALLFVTYRLIKLRAAVRLRAAVTALVRLAVPLVFTCHLDFAYCCTSVINTAGRLIKVKVFKVKSRKFSTSKFR